MPYRCDSAQRNEGTRWQARRCGNLQRRWRGDGACGGGDLIRLALWVVTASFLSAFAEKPLRICIYSDNRGAGEVHREILKEAKQTSPRLFLINGDVVKYDYGEDGTPEAVLADYRHTFRTAENDLFRWPAAPGPVIFVTAGGHDEQYYLDPATARLADSSGSGRYAYEGSCDLGARIYDAFHIEEMRLRVAPYKELSHPLPISTYGDYLVHVGSGARHDLAILVLYRSDRWGFKADQIDWIDSVLVDLRHQYLSLPLIVAGHDWTWYDPDILDDGSLDGANNGVRDGTAELDREQKSRLIASLVKARADLLLAADRHAYSAELNDGMLRINSAAAICTSPDDERVAADNVWLEYSQTASTLEVLVHSVNPPLGCGLRADAAAMGTSFKKNRAPGSVWRAEIQ